MAWSNSRNNEALKDSIKEEWPGTVVGTVGDYQHSTGTSDHNPDDPDRTPAGGRAEQTDSDNISEVRACDAMIGKTFTPSDAKDLFERLTRRPENQERLRYVIYNRRIRSARTGWQDRPYDGDDPHTNHVHASTDADDDNTARPFNLAPDKPEVRTNMTVMFQVKNTAPVYTSDGGHVPSATVRDALKANGVPLILLDTQEELNALMPDAVDVEALADAIVAQLPSTTLTKQDMVDVINATGLTVNTVSIQEH